MAWSDKNVTNTFAKVTKQRKNALDQAYLSQLAGLRGQKGTINAGYNDVRNQAYTNARVSALGNNEALASMGLAGNAYAGPTTGYSETSRVAQDTTMQNALNLANREQQSALNEVDTQVNSARLGRDQSWSAAQSDLLGQEMSAQQQAYQAALAKAQAEVQMFGKVVTDEAAKILGVKKGTKMRR